MQLLYAANRQSEWRVLLTVDVIAVVVVVVCLSISVSFVTRKA